MYLYIFEDGTLKQTNEEPSQNDLQAIKDGNLEIVSFDGNPHEKQVFFGLSLNGYYSVPELEE